MKIKMTSLLLASLTLTGCGGGSSSSSSNTGGNNGNETDKTLINSLEFADQNLHKCVMAEAENRDLTYAEEIYTLNCSELGINTIDGIEQLTELSSLDLINNNLQQLDLSKNSELWYVDAQQNEIYSVTLPHSNQLQFLTLTENALQTIDISSSPNLERLTLANNKLSSITWGNDHSAMTHLDIDMILIRTLDLSLTPNLFDLSADSIPLNDLQTVPLNKLNTLDLFNTDIDVELSHFPNARAFTLTPVTDTIDLSGNSELKSLGVYGEALTSIDIANLTKLERLVIWTENVTDIDLSSNVELTNLTIGPLSLNDLHIDNLNKLEEVDVSSATLSQSTIDYLQAQSVSKGFSLTLLP
ncbi:hypothetical protein [Vibrio sp. PNB22_8_1]|uniref:hypothetical protein n=1 Tax=unclassified Vibrio TaxID=2614977 RepID=UPI00406A963A